MWNVGAEKFMQSIKSVLSDLKIRASYGVNGNQPGALYGYMGLYSYGQNYMGGGGSYESALPNPNLKWEKNYNLNLGLDLAFINRILSAWNIIIAIRKICFTIVLSVALPVSKIIWGIWDN